MWSRNLSRAIDHRGLVFQLVLGGGLSLCLLVAEGWA